MQEKEYIQKCLEQIEVLLNWGTSDQWHNDMFNELSDLIEQKTHVLLSPTTLKRVWGKVTYDNSPSISTLNTLALFAGYNNWRDFKTSGLSHERPDKKVINRPKYLIMVVGLAGVIILFVSIFALTETKKKGWGVTKPEQVEFSGEPVTSGLPNSVVFNFNLAGIRSDSIYIQQFWDPTKTIQVNDRQSQATGIYYYPGYFRAKLIIDGVIVKEHDLFIKSENWSATVDYHPVPKYVVPDLEHGLIHLNDKTIEEVKEQDKPVFTTYHLVNDLGDIDGDNFSLSASLRNVYNDKWAVCQKTQIIILGTKGAMLIPLGIRGCASDLYVMLNNVYISGKDHDLSSFGTDLTQFHDIHIDVLDKQVAVIIDDKIVYESSYNDSMGKIAGVRFKFLGAGEVKDVVFKNSKGESISL